MNNLTKVLIGAGVAAVGITITAVSVKKLNEKKAKESDISEKTTPVKNDSFIERIKLAATKKVVKILAWVVTHERQVAAVGTIISLGSAVFSIAGAVKDFLGGNKLQSSVSHLVEREDAFRNAWNGTIDNYDKDWTTVIDNQKKIMDKLEAMHLDISMLHEVHEALIVPPKKMRKGA